MLYIKRGAYTALELKNTSPIQIPFLNFLNIKFILPVEKKFSQKLGYSSPSLSLTAETVLSTWLFRKIKMHAWSHKWNGDTQVKWGHTSAPRQIHLVTPVSGQRYKKQSYHTILGFMLSLEKWTNKDRFPTLTSSGQSLEQRPLSTEEHTDGRGLDMLLTMCYMSNTITHSAVSVIHVSNNRQVKLPQRVNFSAAVSQNKQTDKQKTISSIITVLKRFAHSNYISNNLIILSVC